MKKVIAFIATPSKKATLRSVLEFEKNLQLYGDIDFEYLFLNEYHLEFCRGCKQCFLKGEEFCPAKDDRDILLAKMDNADGVIFATPTYAFQVSALLKNFLDRLAFLDHRPRFFGKTFTTLVTQGFYGGNDVLKYLNFAAESMGFHTSKGCCITALDPMTELQERQLTQKIKIAAAGFYRELKRPAAAPSFLRLMVFHLGRTSIRETLNGNFRDYQYYKERGWFTSDYFYPAPLGILKKLAGNIFEMIGRQMVKNQ